jgi:hypothetical protein
MDSGESKMAVALNHFQNQTLNLGQEWKWKRKQIDKLALQAGRLCQEFAESHQ